MADTSRLGRYEIRREIARSNDIVYEAVDTLLGRRVALKELLLPPNLVGAAKRERVERFYREARAAGSLTHPHIVTIFEVGEDHGRHYIAMEYLEGQTLRQLLDLEGALPLPRVQEILVQTLDALAYAHANGVVHRDVKPDNLYLLSDGTAKLTDFGIARIMDEPSLTGADQVFGTPSYMSPEQISGKPVDERTDLYSVGVMAYEMLSGRKPFVGENVVALTYQILNVEPAPPPGIPAELAAVVKKAMTKDPAERFQTARTMSDVLKEAFAGGAPLNPRGAMANPLPGSIAATGAGSAVFLPDPNLYPGGLPTGLTGNYPTTPPGMYRRRWRFTLTEGWRQFLIALAGGLLIGIVIVAAMTGVRDAYDNYAMTYRTRAAIGLYNQALAYYNARRYPEAIRDFRVVLRRARGTPLADEALDGIVQSNLQLGREEMGRDIRNAEQYYRAAIEADPSNAQAYLYLGDALERQGHFQAAMDAWQRAMDLDGFGEVGSEARRQMATAHYNRGVAAYNVGDRDAAREFWQKAIDVDPAGEIARRAEDSISRLFAAPYSGF